MAVSAPFRSSQIKKPEYSYSGLWGVGAFSGSTGKIVCLSGMAHAVCHAASVAADSLH